MTSLVLGAAGLFVLRSDMDAPMAGFILTFALDLSSQIFWLLDRVVDLEEHMVSVERIAEGTPPDTVDDHPQPLTESLMNAVLVAHIRPEATGEEGYTVPEDWPQTGEIVCQDLAVRYDSDLPLVLQGVSFTAQVSREYRLQGPRHD
jgi:ABC-type multidrug transport system fused ATPase/permease subunit